MNVLVVGGGGREHALIYKIKQNPDIKNIFCTPGNAGISRQAECINISPLELEKLADFAQSNNVELTVVGPEAPLTNGIVDIFEKRGLKVFGPKKDGAILEGSKVFAKNLMKKYNIPTANFKVFDNSFDAKNYIKKIDYPTVVKADGLAAGKGVIICKNEKEAEEAITEIMDKKVFGEAGNKIVIEDCLEGEEASFIAVTDGTTILPFDSSQDHKPVFDNDSGPNTGGMGAYSPAPVVNNKLYNKIMEKVMEPLLYGFHKEGINYKGVIYAGLMIRDNEPYVLEFNCRFGDPETQPLLVRLDYDLIEIILASINGNLKQIANNVNWSKNASVCVVMASGGYPKNYEKGFEINGLDEVEQMENIFVFHAGTKFENNKIVTNGGRVLGVTSLSPSIKEAINNAYNAVNKIKWKDVHFRKDIGKKALKYL